MHFRNLGGIFDPYANLFFMPDDGGGGGGGGGKKDDDDDTGDGGGDDDDDQDKKFSQADVNRFTTREARAAERKAMQKIADQLGMSVEDAKKFIEDKKANDAAQLSEADRKLAEATEKETAAAKREADAAERELAADIRAALVEADCPRDLVKRAVRLLDLEVGASEDDITSAVEDLKKEMPALFNVEDDDDDEGKPKPVDSAVKGKKPPAPKPGDVKDKAKSLFAERHPERVKSST